MTREEQIRRAAAELDELIIIAQQIVTDMCADAEREATHENAYARVYWLRKQLTSRVVARLGAAGQPSGLRAFDGEYRNL